MKNVLTAAFSMIDKALEMGLIKMRERWTKEYLDTKNELLEQYKKRKIERDHRAIIDLEDRLKLLLETFEKQIENGRN